MIAFCAQDPKFVALQEQALSERMTNWQLQMTQLDQDATAAIARVNEKAASSVDQAVADYQAQVAAASVKLEEISKRVADRVTQIEQTVADVATKTKEADQFLKQVQRAAEEQGVSQQAAAFSGEALLHNKAAFRWLVAACVFAALLLLFAISMLVSFKWLHPESSAEAIQLAAGKVLVFATLSYITLNCAKQVVAHRHNAVVNKHRQNALETYQALVAAAGDAGNRDIVLTKASECIFAPQPTGFSKGESAEAAMSVVSISPGALRPTLGVGT